MNGRPFGISDDALALAQLRYELAEQVGEGSFGVVHRATQRSTGQDVAIKFPRHSGLANPQSAQSQRRFRRELELAARLSHPHIVGLVDTQLNDSEEVAFVVFEYVQGVSITEYLRGKGDVLEEACFLMHQVLDALIAAHKKGVVHRDLKPSNIMVSFSGLFAQAHVLDFGLGGFFEHPSSVDIEPITQSLEIFGTCLLYTSPSPRDQRGSRMPSSA